MNHDLAPQIDHPSINTRISGIVHHPIQSIAFPEGSNVDQGGPIPDHDAVLGVQIKIFEPGVLEPKLKFRRDWTIAPAVESPGLYESAHGRIERAIRPSTPCLKRIEETAQRGVQWEADAHGLAIKTTDGTVGPPGTQFPLSVFKNTKKTLDPNQTRLAIRSVGLEGSPGPHQVDVSAYFNLQGRSPGKALKNKCEINGGNQERGLHATCFRTKTPDRSVNSDWVVFRDSR